MTQLALQLRKRFEEARGPRGDDSSYFLSDSVWNVMFPMTDAYWIELDGFVGESDAAEPAWVGRQWLDTLERNTDEAARRAFDAYVVPAIIEAIAATLPSAPPELTSHPKARQLRDDLAALDGKPLVSDPE
jgi:hypothetical protein